MEKQKKEPWLQYFKTQAGPYKLPALTPPPPPPSRQPCSQDVKHTMQSTKHTKTQATTYKNKRLAIQQHPWTYNNLQ